jgi:hypothetical protein
MQNSLRVIEEIHEEWAQRFGRRFAPLVEEYRLDGADYAIMTLGSMTGAAKDAIDEARDAGRKVGLIKIKTFSPFPIDALLKSFEQDPGAGRGRPFGRLPLELRADVSGNHGCAVSPRTPHSVDELHRRPGRRRHHGRPFPSSHRSHRKAAEQPQWHDGDQSRSGSTKRIDHGNRPNTLSLAAATPRSKR